MCGGREEWKSLRLGGVRMCVVELGWGWGGREAEDLRGEGAFFVEELEEEWRCCLAVNFAGCRVHSER
jgi:hypothetical protein